MSASTKRSQDHEHTLLGNCVLDALIPASKDVTLESLLNDVQATDAIETVDERITTCIVLRCPLIEEHVLKDFLSHISILLEAYAVGNKTTEGHEAPKTGVKELIDSRNVEDTDDPIVAVGSDGDDESQFVYLMWKQELYIDRSRVRAGGPSLYLSAAAKIKTNTSLEEEQDEWMTPYQAESINLFQALQYDPAFKGKKPPVLSAARLHKYTPAGAAVAAQPRPLKNLTRTLHQLVPVVDTRLRCTKLGGSTAKASGPARILAAVEVALANVAVLPMDKPVVQLAKVQVELDRGEARAIANVPLPSSCYPGDTISFVYDLLLDEQKHEPGAETKGHSKRSHALSLALEATIGSFADGDEQSQVISTSWRTNLDMSLLYPTSHTPSMPLAVTVESVSKGFVRLDDTVRWHVLLSNNTSSSKPRPIRIKVSPLLNDPSGETDLVSLKPYVTSHTIRPGSSTTLLIDFRPLREGVLTPPPLRITEIDDKGGEIEGISATVTADKLPDVVVLPRDEDAV